MTEVFLLVPTRVGRGEICGFRSARKNYDLVKTLNYPCLHQQGRSNVKQRSRVTTLKAVGKIK